MTATPSSTPGSEKYPISWRLAIQKIKGISPTTKCILFILSNYYNEEFGCAWPSEKTLCDEAGCSRATFWRCIKEAESAQILRRDHREERRRSANGGWKTMRYYPCLPDGLTEQITAQFDKKKPCFNLRQNENAMLQFEPEPCFNLKHKYTNSEHTKEEPPLSPKGDGLAEGSESDRKEKSERQTALKLETPDSRPQWQVWFDEFWKLYPRREAKTPAMKAFRSKIKSRSTFTTLMAGLARALPDLRARDIKYRPLPSTYLNSEVWTDPVEDSPAAQSDPVEDEFQKLLREVREEKARNTKKPWE